MTERRYSQDEAAAIFERAAQAEQSGRRPLPPGEGMTLAELQAIGGEVGIPADLVAQAASVLRRAGQPQGRTVLGLPIRVGLSVSLGRTLSDREWERLVVDLRETFDARGVVRQDGTLRQWTNGNLQVLVEPDEEGHRVRFRTVNGSARSLMTAGVAALIGGATSLLLTIAGGGVSGPASLAGASAIAVLGGGLIGAGALRLPGWARLRRRQMEEVAERLVRRSLPEDHR